MEVKSGYRQTEVGVIPQEWEIDAIGDAFDISGGFSASRDQLSSHGYCYLHYGDIHKSIKSFIDVRLEYLDIPKLDVPLSRISSKSFLSDGDIVFVDASEDDEGTSKHVVIVNPDVIPYISGLHTIVAKSKTASFDNVYKRYCFQTPNLRRQFFFYSVGTKVSGISKTNIRKIFIPRPPISEQRAIAAALSDLDELLVALDRLITKKRDLKIAAMQQLLTGHVRLPGFRGGWQTKLLGELITHCFSGATPRRSHPNYFDGDIRWITSGELNYNVITDTAEKLTSEAVARTNLKILPIGTFLMAITGLEAEKTRGSCGIVGLPSTTNQSCMAIFPTEGLVTEYLFHYYVLRGKSLALQYCQGTKQQSYTAKLVKQLPIDLPPTNVEQTAIAAVLSDMDAELAALEQRLAKTRELKQGMMQELLTGRTRLI